VRLLDDVIFPAINDLALGRAAAHLRADVAGGAEGRVLELGAGTGLNFLHYPEGAKVSAIEPAKGMRTRAERRVRAPGIRAEISIEDADATRLPYPDASFDTVVATFVFCSIDDLDGAIAELGRVLRPGGALRFVEHGKNPDPSWSRWQHRIQPVWGRLLGGCRLTRDVRDPLVRAGFDVEEVRPVDLPLPRIASAGLIGVARKI